MRVPVIVLGQRFVDAVVKVFVVREDNMAADIVELWTVLVSGSRGVEKGGTHESFRSYVG